MGCHDWCNGQPAFAKADLSTGMVGEFPELQGIIGRYYALHDGEDPRVADAIADHYKPLGPNDTCPTRSVSIVVALADKIDALVCFFAIDEKPTGSRDPFALRRSALGRSANLENRYGCRLQPYHTRRRNSAPCQAAARRTRQSVRRMDHVTRKD